ncbi:IucA/IucC family protein [Acinetobacter ihumii]|uniref:IucA/IucC family protein n=1 Tax=Acinetobacter ihumii TaxID=2483802 RepID=UPI001030C6C6|nr:IucA/IucC family protein [Acinetobacter ihumii]
MKELANRLAMQHLVNAYTQETAKGHLLEDFQQNSPQQWFSRGLTLLVIPIESLNAQVLVALSYVSRVGRHRLASLPKLWINQQIQNVSMVTIATILLEELVSHAENQLDAASLIERWIQSRDALQQFLSYRAEDFDGLIAAEQNFIESEQALLLGHSMHPAPKSRTGFIHEDWYKFSPEYQGQTPLHFWLVHPDLIAEGCAEGELISTQLKDYLKWQMSEADLRLCENYAHYKLLPLHPWQARYLQSKKWYGQFKQKSRLIDLGLQGVNFYPTTSVRTLASFSSPWMLKPSLSVMITNSIRVNLAKECHRGELTHRLWHSVLGEQILKNCPTLKAVNDPAWIALKLDDEVINESICIFREQPFHKNDQITCIASLCQDHPAKPLNRFNSLFDKIHQQHPLLTHQQIAREWFNDFLEISLQPLMYLYHEYGMAFESHQQNVLLELENFKPKNIWLRDNQGFYYIEERAEKVLEQFPELNEKAHAVGPQSFVDERFSYYFFGNTLFGLINAIATTGYVSEDDLLVRLQQSLIILLQQYPDSSLLKGLLYKDSLPYKGNLLTRLHELDELIAPVEHQSVYVELPNPLMIKQEDLRYA